MTDSMTRTETRVIRGAEITITAQVHTLTIDLSFTLNLHNLDSSEPDHSGHNLINYLHINGYSTRQSYWWEKTYRDRTCRTGAQAARIIKAELSRIDDAIQLALIARDARKAHMGAILA